MQRPTGTIFDQLDTERQLVAAVIEVYKDVKDKGQEPGAECWSTREWGRARIDMRVRAAWAMKVKFCEGDCPFTRDAIVGLWIDYRKGDAPRKLALEAFAASGTPSMF
jgi:hypothetical protein